MAFLYFTKQNTLDPLLCLAPPSQKILDLPLFLILNTGHYGQNNEIPVFTCYVYVENEEKSSTRAYTLYMYVIIGHTVLIISSISTQRQREQTYKFPTQNVTCRGLLGHDHVHTTKLIAYLRYFTWLLYKKSIRDRW